MTDEVTSATTVELATELTIAWLGNPNTRASSDDVPAFLKAMYDAVCGLDSSVQPGAAEESSADYTPATTVRRSLSSRDHIISMIDGKPYRTLRRHLWTHGLTPEQYRERYKLKADYPMVAPSYIVMATSTGSTAHAFSAGGPIVWPDVAGMILVPIAAHALFARPLVVGPSSVLALEVLGRSPAHAVLSCDGRRRVDLPLGSRVEVRCSDVPVRLARLNRAPFADRLVHKFELPVHGWRGREPNGRAGGRDSAGAQG